MPRQPKTFRAIRRAAEKAGKLGDEGVVLGPVRTSRASKKTGRTRIGVNWLAKSVWAPDLDPAPLVEEIGDALAYRGMIRVLGGVNQPPLQESGEAMKRARAGRRPPIRGHATGELARNITRSKVVVSGGGKRPHTTSGKRAGVRARCTVDVVNRRGGDDEFGNAGNYVAQVVEAERRGHPYPIDIDDKLVDDIVRRWFDAAVDGAIRDHDERERKAKDL